MESRDDKLSDTAAAWLARRGHAFDALEPLAGDVSPRRYLRLEAAGGGAVLAHYPPESRDAGERFRATTALLRAADVPVPAILDWDRESGFMLLEDAGSRTVFDAVRAGAAPRELWERGLEIAARIAGLEPRAVERINPRLDAATLRRELRQSWDLVLAPDGLVGDGALADELELALLALCDHLAAAPPRPCHRDFMARNLLLSPAGELTVIDHQDLRLGPPWYDVASLLNDSIYVSAREEGALLDRARVPRPERLAYHRAAAQRALKIVGTFAAFARRGFDRHLALVPPSLAAARRHLARLPETAPVVAELAAAWEEVDDGPPAAG